MPAKIQGRARKAEAADRKAAQEAEVREQEEEQKWQKGAKGKTAADDRREKEDAKSRKREELKRLQEEDEASTPGKKSSGKQSNNSKPSAKAKGSAGPNDLDDLDMQIASFSASNLDDALEAMTLVNDRSDKASRGAAAGAVEKHPERRFKAAFEAYKERQLPKLREEHPGLRLQQYNDLLYKQFQKSPENPFNQLHVSYDASKEDKLSLLKAKRDASARRLAA